MKEEPMNKVYKTVLSFLVVVIAVEFPGRPCFAFDDGDVQFWSTASASFNINKDWKGKFEEEFRFGDNAGTFSNLNLIPNNKLIARKLCLHRIQLDKSYR
ncbi:MAG TPA: hypothetical protein DIU00_00020 [Phycisphaerales bacterium]|nr:hypothetical protein [Phycisphaerales bacterium]